MNKLTDPGYNIDTLPELNQYYDMSNRAFGIKEKLMNDKYASYLLKDLNTAQPKKQNTQPISIQPERITLEYAYTKSSTSAMKKALQSKRDILKSLSNSRGRMSERLEAIKSNAVYSTECIKQMQSNAKCPLMLINRSRKPAKALSNKVLPTHVLKPIDNKTINAPVTIFKDISHKSVKALTDINSRFLKLARDLEL